MKVAFAWWLAVLLAAYQVAAQGRALYNILQVSPSASNDEIKKAYKLLTKKNHPDKGGSNSRFVAISQAYKTLSDPERRKEYDIEGEITKERYTVLTAHDIYKSFWRENAHHLSPPVQEYEHSLKVTLAQIYTGGNIQVTLRQQEHCSHCGGSGAEHFDICPICRGQGIIPVTQEIISGVASFHLELCECGGTGTVIREPCPVCNGDKMTMKATPLIIPLPQGALGGHRIRIKHKDKTVRDLVFRTIEQEEPGWRRKGGDLFLNKTIDSLEASFGFSCTILHVNGTNFTVSREGETESGFTETLRGMGMPHPPSFMGHFRWSRFGDLHITYHVALPDELPLEPHLQFQDEL